MKNFIGIDVSKATLDVTALVGSTQQGIYCKFSNQPKGRKTLLKWVNSHNLDLKETVFCMEHTGLYSRVLASFLASQGCTTWVENPIVIKKSMGLQRGKMIKLTLDV